MGIELLHVIGTLARDQPCLNTHCLQIVKICIQFLGNFGKFGVFLLALGNNRAGFGSSDIMISLHVALLIERFVLAKDRLVLKLQGF